MPGAYCSLLLAEACLHLAGQIHIRSGVETEVVEGAVIVIEVQSRHAVEWGGGLKACQQGDLLIMTTLITQQVE